MAFKLAKRDIQQAQNVVYYFIVSMHSFGMLAKQQRGKIVDISVGDLLVMKKPHPCQSHEMDVLRVGADFRLRCRGCGHVMMVSRAKVEKNIKQVKKPTED